MAVFIAFVLGLSFEHGFSRRRVWIFYRLVVIIVFPCWEIYEEIPNFLV
jgi:hypothetical protein